MSYIFCYFLQAVENLEVVGKSYVFIADLQGVVVDIESLPTDAPSTLRGSQSYCNKNKYA